MKQFVVFCIGCLWLVQVQAQKQMPQAVLDSVTVYENRLHGPYAQQNKNVLLLTRKQIDQLPVRSTNELLAYVAGVDIRQRGPNGTQADVSMDGGTFDQVLVLVNGVKVSDPQTGHNMLNLPIPMAAIDHIEVFRGPAARVFGINALAGAINIITRLPQENECSAQAYEGSSFLRDTASRAYYHASGIMACGGINKGGQAHLITAAHDQGNGFRYNTAYNAYRAFYQSRIRTHQEDALEVMGGYVSNQFGAHAFYAAPGDKESEETIQTALGAVGYQLHSRNKRLKIMPRISYRYAKDDYIYIRQQPDVFRNIHESHVITGEVQAAYTLKNGIAGAGLESRKENLNSTNLGKRQRNNTGFFAEYKHFFSQKLNVDAGLYANYNSDYGLQVFPGIGIGYQLLPRFKIAASATTGQRLPTYTDLYYNGPSNIGNDSLTPEYARYAEAGIQYQQAYIQVKAAYFYRYVTDFIDWVRDTDTAQWQPQNFQSIRTHGLTFQADYWLSNQLGFSSGNAIVLYVGYTYLHPKIIENKHAQYAQYAIEALRHQVIFSVQSTLNHNWQISLNTRYQQRINANDYTLIDARVGYAFDKKLMIYADVTNLLNTQYKETSIVPLPGRWYTFGVRMLR
jgi:iron complex outermembrane receptor protein